jgi:membrane protease YdiL (CAAX protease family)
MKDGFTMKRKLPPGLSALLEACVMFLPAIPAYLWLWPNVEGAGAWIANSLSDLYAVAGSLVIGLRRWSLDQLGVNRKGLWLGLACGLAVVAGRTLVILSVDWNVPRPQFRPLGLAGEFVFDFALVAIGQELLYRGLIYRAFEDWRGTRWAIWGSSICFGFWHLGGGPLIIVATAFYGLIFALIRWRTGSILGAILVHGLVDFTTALLLPLQNIDLATMGRPNIPHPSWMILGLVLIAAPPIYLWLLHPYAERFFTRKKSA